MGNPDELRARASECFELAERCSHWDAATEFVHLALAYERLADWERRRSTAEERLQSVLQNPAEAHPTPS